MGIDTFLTNFKRVKIDIYNSYRKLSYCELIKKIIYTKNITFPTKFRL